MNVIAIILPAALILSMVFTLSSLLVMTMTKNGHQYLNKSGFGIFTAVVEYQQKKYYLEIATGCWLPEGALTESERFNSRNLAVKTVDEFPS